MISEHDTYLGDGLYASDEGSMIMLKTQREDAEHWIALETDVFEALIQFAISIGWLKKGQTPS